MMDDLLLPPLCICQYNGSRSSFLGFYSKNSWEDQGIVHHFGVLHKEKRLLLR